MNKFKETQPLNLDELGRHAPMVPHAPIMKLIPNPSMLTGCVKKIVMRISISTT